MAINSFIPNNTWTTTGDVVISSGVAQIIPSGINILPGLSTMTNGVTITGWTRVTGNGTFIKQVNTVPVARLQAAGNAWNTWRHNNDTYLNATIKAKVRARGERVSIYCRNISGSVTGYTVGHQNNDDFFQQGRINANGIGLQDTTTNTSHSSSVPQPSLPYSVELLTRNEDNGDVVIRTWLSDTLMCDRVDRAIKNGIGSVGVQQGGSTQVATGVTDYETLEVFKEKSGTTTLVATPYSISGWTRVSLDGDFSNSRFKKMSEFAKFKILGGSPSVLTPLPDNGILTGIASGGSGIQIELTLENGWRHSQKTFLSSVDLQIDGEWTGPVVPQAPSNLSLVPTSTRSLKLTWTDGLGNDSYHAKIGTTSNSNNAIDVGLAVQGVRNIDFNYLHWGTQYYVWLFGISPVGIHSSMIGPVMATTNIVREPMIIDVSS